MVAVEKKCNRPQDRDLPAGQPRRSEAPSRCAGIPRRPDRSADIPNAGSARNSSSVAYCCCRDESAPACGLRFLTAKLAGLGRAAVMEKPRAAALRSHLLAQPAATVNKFAEKCSIFSFKLAVLSYLSALNVVKSILFGKR